MSQSDNKITHTHAKYIHAQKLYTRKIFDYKNFEVSKIDTFKTFVAIYCHFQIEVYLGKEIAHLRVRDGCPHRGHCRVRARLRKCCLQIERVPHELQ